MWHPCTRPMGFVSFAATRLQPNWTSVRHFAPTCWTVLWNSYCSKRRCIALLRFTMLAIICLYISLLAWLGFIEWINRLDSPRRRCDWISNWQLYTWLQVSSGIWRRDLSYRWWPPPPHVSVNWQTAVIKTRQLHTSALLSHDYLRQQCFAIFRQYDCSTEGLRKRNSSVMQLCGSVGCKCKWKSCGTKLICKCVEKACYTLDAV